MQFGKSIGTACSSFAITNIDDMFVLATFFAEASTSKATTPLKITIGQYIGFTVIIVISMIGFGVSLVLPSEPIGFLGYCQCC
jgi:cadmium resistance protein CadD (predicted permease)